MCRKKFLKWELNRFVYAEGRIIWDQKQILPGRGAYLCLECLPKKDTPKGQQKLLKSLKKGNHR